MKTIFLKFIACLVVLLSAQTVLFAKTFTDYGRVWYVKVPNTATPSDITLEIKNKLDSIETEMSTTQSSAPAAFTLLFPLRTYQVDNVKLTFSFPSVDNMTLHIIGLTEDLAAVESAFGSTQGSQASLAQNNFINAHLAKSNMSCTSVPSDSNFLTSSPTVYPTLEMTMAPSSHRSAEFFEITNPINGSELFKNTVNMMGLRFTDNTPDYVFYYNSQADKHPLYPFTSGVTGSSIYYTIYVKYPYNIYMDNLIVENMWANGFFIYGEINTSNYQKNKEVIIEDNLLQNIWGRNNANIPASMGIQLIGMKDAVIRRNKINNDLAVTQQLAGGIGLCGGCERNRDVLMENNEVCGYEYSYWLEGNSGGIELKGNRSIGTENGLTVSRNIHYVKDRPYNVNYIHENYFSNEGLDPTYPYYSAQYGSQAGRMLWFDGTANATEFVKLRNNTIEIDESKYITYRWHLFDTSGNLTIPDLYPSSLRSAMYIGQHNLQFLCNTVTVNGSGTNQTQALIPSNKGWLLNNTFDNLDLFENHCDQKQNGNTFINIPVINSGNGPCSTNTAISTCEIDYDTTQILNGIFTLKYSIHEPCNEGAASAFAYSVSGGTPGYSFTMDGIQVGYPNTPDGTVTNLTKGLHTFMIEDNNGVSASFTFNIDIDVYYICTKTTASQIIPGENRIDFLSAKILLVEDLTVDIDTLNFYDCTIHVRPGHKIQVGPGSLLYFKNCTLLTGCGQDMWDGIYADDPTAQITIENSTLRDMENGIHVSLGAKLNVHNNQFIDNYNSLRIHGNTNLNDVTITQNNFGVSGNPLLAPHSGELPQHGIYVSNCEKLLIGSYTATGLPNTFSQLNNGIYIQQVNPCFVSSAPPAEIICSYNEFNDITGDLISTAPEKGTGIYGAILSIGSNLMVTVSNPLLWTGSSSFDNCKTAVRMVNASCWVERQKIQNGVHGVWISEADGHKYDVHNNQITNCRYGITKQGDESNYGFKVGNNQITLPNVANSGLIQLTPRGIYSGYSSISATGHSEILNNQITIPNGKRGIGISLQRGTGDLIQGNHIAMTSTQTETQINVPKMIGIYSQESVAPKIINNIIDNNHSQNSNATNYVTTHNAGIYLENNYNSLLDCNTMNYTKYGVFAVGKNGSDVLYDRTVGNTMNNSHANFMLFELQGDGTLGQVGINNFSPLIIYDANNTFFEPSDINPGMGNALLNKVYRVSNCNQAVNDRIVTTANKLTQARSTSSGATQCQVEVPPVSNFTQTYTCGGSTQFTDDLPVDANFIIQVVDDEIVYTDFAEGARQADEELIFVWLQAHEEIRSEYPILDSFYLSRYQSLVGLLQRVDDAISALGDSALRSQAANWQAAYLYAINLNNSINSSELFATNAKAMNAFHLQKLGCEGVEFTSEEWEFIESIASGCPFTMGNAVHRARVLYSEIDPEAHYDNLEICNSQGVFKNGSSKLQSQLNSIEDYIRSRKQQLPESAQAVLFPNPANAQVTIQASEASRLQIWDLLGNQQVDAQLNPAREQNTFDIAQLAPGVYLYKVFTQSGQAFNGKLIKE